MATNENYFAKKYKEAQPATGNYFKEKQVDSGSSNYFASKYGVAPREQEEPSSGFLDTAGKAGITAAQTGAALASGAALGTVGVFQGSVNAVLRQDADLFDQGVEQWTNLAYQPTDPDAQKIVGAIGEGYEHLADSTEELLGRKGRMIVEAGLALAPMSKGLMPKVKGIKGAMDPATQAKALKEVTRQSTGVLTSPELMLLRNHGEKAMGNMRQMEAGIARGKVEYNGVVEGANPKGYIDTLKGLEKKLQKVPAEYEKYVLAANNNRDVFRAILQKELGPEMGRTVFNRYVDNLATRRKELKKIKGDEFRELEGYTPRSWKTPGKKEVAGMSSPVARNLSIARNKYEAGKITREQWQRSITKAMMGHESKVTPITTQHIKKRKIDVINKGHLENMRSPAEALEAYNHSTSEFIGESKYLGRNSENKGSVQDFIMDSQEGMGPKQAASWERAHNARFGPKARAGGSKWMSKARDLGYMGTIADVASAVVQLGDVAAAFGRQGPWQTSKAVVSSAMPRKLRQKLKTLEPEEIGYTDILHEIADHKGGSKKVLDKLITYSGFKMMDKYGKRVVVTAAANRLRKQASKNSKTLRQDYGWLGDKLPGFLEDLKTGNINNKNMQFAVFNELMDVQPITLSQMPMLYLEHPDGRIAYSLKTWAIRQINRYREDAIKGNYKRLMATAASVYMGTNSIKLAKDFLEKALSGEELTAEDISLQSINTLLQMGGSSKYQMSRLARGDVVGGTMEMMAPPVLGFAGNAIQGDPARITSMVPIVGRMIAASIKAGYE